MAIGKMPGERQEELFIAASAVGHPEVHARWKARRNWRWR